MEGTFKSYLRQVGVLTQHTQPLFDQINEQVDVEDLMTMLMQNGPLWD